jgi:DHA1 family tetracycline resistance protein-like MFS transporter
MSRPVSPSPSKIPAVNKGEVEQLRKKVEALSDILRGKDEEIVCLQQSLSKVEQDLHNHNNIREEAMLEAETTFDRDLDELLSDALGELDTRQPESDSERQEHPSQAEQLTQTRTNQRRGNKGQRARSSNSGVEMLENGSSETQIQTREGDEQIEHVQGTNIGYVDFFKVFFAAKGAPQILLLGFLLSFGFGSIIGVVPAVLSDRFARIHHGYDGPNCSDFDRSQKPDACQQGADDAQAAVVLTTFIQNMLTLVCNTTVGSVSDARGRRHIMILSMLLYTFSPAVLVLMQVIDSMDPVWYFVSFALVGVVNWVSIGFSMLSDVIPAEYRAASFGLFVSSFYLGFCLGPSCVLAIDHFAVSVLSLTTMLVALLVGWITLPETLPEQVAERNLVERTNLAATSFRKAMLRPIREMSILNRDTFFRLLTIAYFFSGMVHSSDRSLVLFYMEDQLDVRDGDLATMFFIMGIVGVVVQGVLLELLLTCLGEKGLLVVSFLSGTVHNLLYGLAKSKGIIYFALCLSQLTKTNFALVSSIASNNVSGNEQGRMQGALFALSAVANAIGPVTLQLIYDHTKGGNFLGPGTMFVFASALYFVGTCFVTCIPGDRIKPSNTRERNESDLEEPLLGEQSCDDI